MHQPTLNQIVEESDSEEQTSSESGFTSDEEGSEEEEDAPVASEFKSSLIDTMEGFMAKRELDKTINKMEQKMLKNS